MKRWQANSLLLLAAIIWGAAFTAQSVGMEHLGPFSFNAIRFSIGGIVMLPVVALRQRSLKKKGAGPESPSLSFSLFRPQRPESGGPAQRSTPVDARYPFSLVDEGNSRSVSFSVITLRRGPSPRYFLERAMLQISDFPS